MPAGATNAATLSSAQRRRAAQGNAGNPCRRHRRSMKSSVSSHDELRDPAVFVGRWSDTSRLLTSSWRRLYIRRKVGGAGYSRRQVALFKGGGWSLYSRQRRWHPNIFSMS